MLLKDKTKHVHSINIELSPPQWRKSIDTCTSNLIKNICPSYSEICVAKKFTVIYKPTWRQCCH